MSDDEQLIGHLDAAGQCLQMALDYVATACFPPLVDVETALSEVNRAGLLLREVARSLRRAAA